MSEVYQSSNAAANLTKIFEAAAEAKKSQVDLQKEIMLHQIQQKMDLEKNAAELHQGNVSGIEKKQMNVDWLKGMGGEDMPSASSPNGTGPSGIADSGTPTSVGSNPMASMMSPAQAPQPTAAPNPTPMLDASAQRPNNPALNGIVPQAPTTASVTAPQAQPMAAPVPQQPSPQYQNLGYKPKEAQELLQERQQAGQRPNVADAAYVQSLNKVKAGTASQGELDMVNKMNNQSGDSTSPPLESTKTPIQKGLNAMEKAQGLPEGALWMNPTTMEAEISPIWKSKQEALNKYAIEAPDRYGKLAEQDLMHVFSMRSGALGVQDAKINQAMHIKQLFDQAYDPKTGIYNLKAPQFAEATQGLAVLVSNSNQTSEGQRNEIKQRTLKGDFNGALTYFLGVPKNATSQEIAKMYIDTVDRQGLTAQTIKEKDISDIKGLDSFNQLKKIAPERAKNLYQANFGIDYRDYIQKPWQERIKMVTGEDPMNGLPSGTGPMNDSGGSGRPTIFNPKTSKTMTLSEDGKRWE